MQTHFSAAGELIGRLLQQADPGQPARPLQGSAPLLAAPGADTAQLTQNLQQSLEGSGLFYESHLEQWSRGERTLEQIRQEPQNRTGGEALTTQLLPQQLDTLEQRRLVWQGELWPGQPMQWELVQDKDPDRQAREPGQPAAWETVLKLELPQLGQVNATIRLQGEQAQVRLRVLDEVAAAALQADQTGLDDALAAAGTVLGGFLVQRDAAVPGRRQQTGWHPMSRKPEAMRQAVALAYQGGQAPKVVATGKGAVADRIIALAREHGVYVHESRELVALLSEVELDREVPPQLYRVVAELLAWLYRIEAALPPSKKPPAKAPRGPA